MRSLFLRIFLWFWAAMLAAVAVLVVTSPMWTQSRPGVERWQRDAESVLEERVTAAVAAFERGGDRPPFDRAPPPHRGPPLRIQVLDEDGVAADGSPVDPEVRELARRSRFAGEAVTARTGSNHLMARPAIGPDGRTRVVVGSLRRPPRAIDLLDPRVMLPRLAILTVVVGLFCLLLARHLSAPFVPLRAATQQLAAGDLSARVGPPVARRGDEIGDLARDFDAMAGRLEQLVTSQRRLLRDVSHELRSPLARLEVALELARQRGDERVAGPLERIGRESARLNELIGQLLSLARLESGGTEPQRDPVDLGRLLEEVVADASYEAEGRACSVALAQASVATVSGSASLLRSAIENVLRNAVVHAPAGSEIGVELATAQAAGGRAEAVVSVRDRGPGVPEDELSRLFEPFYRISEARDRHTGGVGLGLAITERAVRWHGGSVEANNLAGGGLEVIIRLPLG